MRAPARTATPSDRGCAARTVRAPLRQKTSVRKTSLRCRLAHPPLAPGFHAAGRSIERARLAGGASDVPFKRTADTEPVAATPGVEARRGVHSCHRGEVDRVAPWTFQFEHAVAGLDARAVGGASRRDTFNRCGGSGLRVEEWRTRGQGRIRRRISERSTPSPAGHRNGVTASTWMPAQTSAAATTLATTHDVCG